MDVRSLYDRLHREPQDFPLFDRIWQVLTFSPACREANEEELTHLSIDAFDYLQASGAWQMASLKGSTQLEWNGERLDVREDDGKEFRYQHTFSVYH
jgi:hypothetical protein